MFVDPEFITYFLNSVDSKAVERLDGRMLLRLQDLRKEVEIHVLFDIFVLARAFTPVDL